MIKPVKESITNQVYEILRRQILNQTYGFGCKININKLAKDLNVSNTPIREALFMLEKDGLIIINPNSGPKVVEMNENRFNEIVDTTLVLLIGGYYLCLIKDKIPKLIEMMEDVLQQQKNILISGSDPDYAKKSIIFEECILLALDNSKLCSIYNALFDLLFLAALYDHQHGEVDRNKSIQAHEQILNSVKENNHDLVVELIREHYCRDIKFIN